MHKIDLILTLAGGLTAALLFGHVTHRLDRERGRVHADLFGEARG